MRARVERIPVRAAARAAACAAAPDPPAASVAANASAAGRERVEDRLVADGTAAPPGKTRGRGEEHLAHERRIERHGVAGAKPGLDQGGPVERPRRAADRRHESMPDRAEEVARAGIGRKLREELLDRPESCREVVAVVAVAEDGIQPGQRRCVAVDGLPGTMERRPEVGCIDRHVGRLDGERVGRRR